MLLLWCITEMHNALKPFKGQKCMESINYSIISSYSKKYCQIFHYQIFDAGREDRCNQSTI